MLPPVTHLFCHLAYPPPPLPRRGATTHAAAVVRPTSPSAVTAKIDLRGFRGKGHHPAVDQRPNQRETVRPDPRGGRGIGGQSNSGESCCAAAAARDEVENSARETEGVADEWERGVCRRFTNSFWCSCEATPNCRSCEATPNCREWLPAHMKQRITSENMLTYIHTHTPIRTFIHKHINTTHMHTHVKSTSLHVISDVLFTCNKLSG